MEFNFIDKEKDYEGVSTEYIKNIESKLNVYFPEVLKEFWEKYNNAEIKECEFVINETDLAVDIIYSIGGSKYSVEKEYSYVQSINDGDKIFVPFAEGAGDIYCFDLNTKKVYIVYHDGTPPFLVCNTVEEFFEILNSCQEEKEEEVIENFKNQNKSSNSKKIKNSGNYNQKSNLTKKDKIVLRIVCILLLICFVCLLVGVIIEESNPLLSSGLGSIFAMSMLLFIIVIFTQSYSEKNKYNLKSRLLVLALIIILLFKCFDIVKVVLDLKQGAQEMVFVDCMVTRKKSTGAHSYFSTYYLVGKAEDGKEYSFKVNEEFYNSNMNKKGFTLEADVWIHSELIKAIKSIDK